MKVEFYRHHLGETEKAHLAEVIDSVFLTTGPRTREFETRFAEYLGVKHCVGMSSWTTGAFAVLKALGIGEGDEVITTPMTFIASANIILHAGARPVFVDVEPETGNIDADQVEAAITGTTKAILPVHLYGQMCDMKKLGDIAAKHELAILEDAAHCVEGTRDGCRPGQRGTAASFSFYATKNVTCGEGGAVVTDDDDLYEHLLHLRLHGMSKSAADRYSGTYQHWDMVELGYKANMFDLQAALLLPQLGGIENRLQRREEISRRYEEAFVELEGVSFPRVLEGARSARHLFTIWVDPARRDAVLSALQKAGIGVAVNFRAVHLLSYYRQVHGYEEGSFPEAERIGNSTITLPLYPLMSDEAVEYVIEKVREICT